MLFYFLSWVLICPTLKGYPGPQNSRIPINSSLIIYCWAPECIRPQYSDPCFPTRHGWVQRSVSTHRSTCQRLHSPWVSWPTEWCRNQKKQFRPWPKSRLGWMYYAPLGRLRRVLQRGDDSTFDTRANVASYAPRHSAKIKAQEKVSQNVSMR